MQCTQVHADCLVGILAGDTMVGLTIALAAGNCNDNYSNNEKTATY